MKKYTMRRDGWTDKWELHIAKTARSMRAHARKVAQEHHSTPWNSDALLAAVMELGVVRADGLFAIMFLNEENLDVNVVAHEALHLALAHERTVARYGMLYDHEEGPEDEERLAYYHGDVVRAVCEVLVRDGLVSAKALTNVK